MNVTPQPPGRVQIWLLAARPKTLPAAAASSLVGSALAFAHGKFQLGPALACLLAAMLLQIGSNFANDVFDFQRGTDAHNRLGPLRVTQAGLLTPAQVYTGMLVVFGCAALLGVYLIWIGGWPILIIGLASILAAIAYTGGPLPFGYYGLGDLAVFAFFGLAAVCGTYYVQAGALHPAAWWAAVPMGLLITALLDVNNLRDIDSDRAAGKHTLAVRLGARGARLEYLLCLAGAYLTALLAVLLGQAPAWVLLSWLCLPLAGYWLRRVYRENGRPLNQALAGTAQLILVFALLYSLGLIVSVFI